MKRTLPLLSAWAALHGPVLAWWGRALWRREAELNVVVGAVLLLLAVRARVALGRALSQPLSPRPGPLVLLVGGSLLVAAARVWLPMHPLMALGTGLSAFGLVGLVLPARAWRRAAPLALLAVCVLPIAGYLDVYVGFPARRLTAAVVSLTLQAAGVPHLSTGTVLVLASGAASVDLPCAGVRSLWTGGVFLFAATWLEGRTLDRGFVLAGGLLVSTLFLANTLRVAALVWLLEVLHQPLVAEVLHGPLGVLGFLGACGLTWLALRLSPSTREPAVASPRPVGPHPRGWLGLALSLALLAMTPTRGALPGPGLSPQLAEPYETLELTEEEQRFAAAQGGHITKGRLHGAVEAEVIWVTSRHWTAQHLPRHCLTAAGLHVEDEHPVWVAGEPVRVARTERGTALWWFQSAHQRTDDHTARVWAGLRRDEPWTLVSVLVDAPPQDPAVRDLVIELRGTLARQLENS